MERQLCGTHEVRAECAAAFAPQLGSAAGCIVSVSRWEWARGVGTRFFMCCVRCAVRWSGSGVIRCDAPATRTVTRCSVTGCWAFTPDGRFHSRRARRPASCARGLSAREEAGPDPLKDADWRETIVYTPGGCRGGRSDIKADSGRVYRAELGPPLAERRRAFRILFYPPDGRGSTRPKRVCQPSKQA